MENLLWYFVPYVTHHISLKTITFPINCKETKLARFYVNISSTYLISLSRKKPGNINYLVRSVSLQHQDIIKCKQWRHFPLQYVYRSVERRIMYVILVRRAPLNLWDTRKYLDGASRIPRWLTTGRLPVYSELCTLHSAAGWRMCVIQRGHSVAPQIV